MAKGGLNSMEVKKTVILDGSEPLSKVLTNLDENPAVIITKKGKYYGIIDHRSVGDGFKKPHETRSEKAVVRPPVIVGTANIPERIGYFLQGHFKALPVVDENHNAVAVTTRVELLKDLLKENMVPKGSVRDIMSKPVYTIDEEKKIGGLKKTLKIRNARRLIVTRKGKPVGVVSDFDIGEWKDRHNLAGGRKDVHLSEPIDFDEMRISGFLRPDVTLLPSSSTLTQAAKKMIDKEVSRVIITSEDKPAGVLSALDLFKYLHRILDEKITLQISGLGEENIRFYGRIEDKIGHVLDKYRRSFNIRDPKVHVKEDKKAVRVNVIFLTDEGHISLKGERATLKETVDELAVELDTVLNKKKEMRRIKPRARRYGGVSGTDYRRRDRR
ncbi:CBS domain-containing protein [Candidatus Micrarchaeota archaeon]|nr:CBS domain-containing protein [Candidatus Micrarchaeota archaeon]